MTLSEQQIAVIDWFLNSVGHLLLRARAGCGKSTTLIELTKVIVAKFPHMTTLLCVFGREASKDLQAKLVAANIPWNQASASTIHSNALRAWANYCKPYPIRDHIDNSKCAKILDAAFEKLTDEQKKTNVAYLKIQPYKSALLELVSLAKQNAFGVLCAIEDKSKWFDIIEHHALDENLPDDHDLDYLVRNAIALYKKSLELCKTTIDNDDMILAPLYFKVRAFAFDNVLVDEGQDLNSSRFAWACKILKPNGRMLVVGDDKQAIMGFTGALNDALEIVKAKLNAHELPLTVTRRCPKVVVRRANKFCKDFVAHPDAPEGVERVIYYHNTKQNEGKPMFASETFAPTSAILCRNTAPLVKLAYDFLKRGIACKVEGRKIGDKLVSLARRFKIAKLDELIPAVEEYKVKQCQVYLSKHQESKAAELSDRCDTIVVLAQGRIEQNEHTTTKLVAFIDSLFSDTKAGDKPMLTLCTQHKSKGREWQTVYLLGNAIYNPSPWARQDWQKDQEDNLEYVAITRSMFELVDIILDEKL